MTACTLLIAAVAQADDALLTQGARVSAVGMVIVFIGLVVLTLTLPQLRRVVERIEGRKAAKREAAVQEQTAQNPAVSDEEVAAAVCAINAHLKSLEQIESVRLTLGLYDKPYRPWRLAGRAEVLLGRQALGSRSRNRSL